MKKIGIDFGTTNSTIAYKDERLGEIVGHKFGGGGGAEYFPSAIAYSRKNGNEIWIGKEARLKYQNSPDDYYYYEYYKLALVADWKKTLDNKHGKRVIDVVKDYLGLLVNMYKEQVFTSQSDLKGKLEYIAMAVPNAVSEGHVESAEDIKNELSAYLNTLADDCGFYSEATCACAFYTDKSENKKFTGNIVIVDYGGGTLDISNCRVSQNQNGNGKSNITVVVQRGTTVDEQHEFGFAGVAFDKGVVEELTKGEKLSGLDIEDYRNDFEDFKIEAQTMITKALQEFYETGEAEDLNCRLAGKGVKLNVELLQDVFDKNNLPLLKKHFQDVVPAEERKKGGAAKQGAFRVLLVGGFSQLVCVERAVRDLLSIGLNDLYDQRIAQLNASEKYIAVAYGAAVYANDPSILGQGVTLADIGIKAFDGQDYYNELLVPENTDMKELRDTRWGQSSYAIVDAVKASVTVWCRSSSSGEQERKFSIANVCTDNCKVKFGVSVKGKRLMLNVKNLDDSREIALEELQQFLDDYKNRG